MKNTRTRGGSPYFTLVGKYHTTRKQNGPLKQSAGVDRLLREFDIRAIAGEPAELITGVNPETLSKTPSNKYVVVINRSALTTAQWLAKLQVTGKRGLTFLLRHLHVGGYLFIARPKLGISGVYQLHYDNPSIRRAFHEALDTIVHHASDINRPIDYIGTRMVEYSHDTLEFFAFQRIPVVRADAVDDYDDDAPSAPIDPDVGKYSPSAPFDHHDDYAPSAPLDPNAGNHKLFRAQ